MTLQEMIEALENGPMNYTDEEDWVLVPHNTALDIANKLRDGQEMRNCFTTIDSNDGTSWAIEISRGSLSVAGQAWDAAGGGE